MTTSKYHTGTQCFLLQSVKNRHIGTGIGTFNATAVRPVSIILVQCFLLQSKVQNLRKTRNFGHNFSIFAHCHIDLKAN